MLTDNNLFNKTPVCNIHSYFFSSVQLHRHLQLFCDPMGCSRPGLPIHHQFPEFTQTHVHWVGDAIQPSHPLCPLLLPPSIFPSIRVFSNKLVHIRWPKYWSFSFNISPSSEYSGLISFRMDWLDLLAVQGTLKSLLQHHSSNAPVPSFSAKGQRDFQNLLQGSFLVICAYWPTSLKILKD